MQIDWLTLVAQAVNFLVLVYLLRRYLYRPVIAAMARREAGIAQQLQAAAAREQEAEQLAAHLREKTEALERTRNEWLSVAAKEVEDQRHAMLEDARQEVDTERNNWLDGLTRERQEFFRLIKPRAAAVLVRTARRMLSDMAEGELEQQLIRTFLKQLATLDHDALASLRKSAHKAAEIRVTTSFELDSDTRTRLNRAIRHHLLDDKDVPIEFLRSDALICGIEINTEGRKLGWTVNNYLHALEQELEQALNQEPRQEKADA